MEEKLKLYGFNNLTKALSFNIYDICYAKSPREQEDYIQYIDEQYNSERLTNIISKVTDMIGARILNIAKQDYEPQGASVAMLIAESGAAPRKRPAQGAGETILAHLDKSHVTVHTYPEFHPETSIATFRVDIDVATCGEITPLKTLDYLISRPDIKIYKQNVSEADVYINPDLKGFSAADFKPKAISEMIDRGLKAAESKRSAILSLKKRIRKHSR